MDLAQLKDNWKIVALLAIPGVICSTFLIGTVIYQVWDIGFLVALLFGALITPTDPISVLSILKKVRAPAKLNTILEGESLFNDGTGVVLFTVILGLTAKVPILISGIPFWNSSWLPAGGCLSERLPVMSRIVR